MKPRLLVLQASSYCNLNCGYCYVQNRHDRSIMSDATLQAALRLTLPLYGDGEALRILWHAGEPLAVGLGFYERAAGLIRAYKVRGAKISHAIQTNGTLIDDNWCQFFVREKFTIGLSVDGPAQVHDRQRKNWSNAPTHSKVMKGLALLRKSGIRLNAIAVLTRHSLDYPDEIFSFFSDEGFEHVGFNLEETEGAHTRSSDQDFSGDQDLGLKYKAFMARLFELWMAAGKLPRIREFESMGFAISAFLKDNSYARVVGDLIPFHNLSITREGDVSTFSPELANGTVSDPLLFSLGNVHKLSALDDLQANPKFQEMSHEINQGVARCRSECEYFALCGGGTASNKFYERGTFDCTETITCTLTRKILSQVIAEGLRKDFVRYNTESQSPSFAA